MELNYIDYLANFHPNIFRRAAARYKLAFTAVLIAGAIIFRSIFLLAAIYFFMLLLIFLLRLPVFKIWLFSLYPLIFTAIFIYASFSGLESVLMTALKVLSISLAVVFLICTTSYPKIFHSLGHFLPQLVSAGLYMTYRAIFIFLNLVSNLFDALKLKGGWNRHRPLNSLKSLSLVFGFLFIKSIDLGQKMTDIMRLRGFSGKIHYHEKSAHWRDLVEPANLLVIFLSAAVLGIILYINFI